MAGHLSRRTLASFGQLALPLAIADLPLSIYLSAYYGGDIGVPLAAMSWVLLVARLADVVVDPLIGVFSDRSAHWPLGRRKSWLLMGIPVLMLGIYMVFFATRGAGAFYMLTWVFCFYLGWTLITIPYGAWGAELSPDYHERNRITGWRTLFGFAGIFLASIAPIFLGGGAGTAQGLTPIMHGLGLWAIIALPFAAVLIWRFVPEPRVLPTEKKVTFTAAFKAAASNGPFMRILLATVVGAIGSNINTTVVAWYFVFAAGLGAKGGLPVLVYLLAALLSVPLWVALGYKYDKHKVLIWASLVSVAIFGCLFFVPRGDLMLACLVMGLAGIGGSASGTLSPSISADAIDLDALRSGEQRAGILVAFWAMGGKFATAIGGFIALQILAWYGFNAQAETNSEDAIWGLQLTYILVPWVFYFISIVLLWNFPITHKVQVRMRRLIDRKAARRAAREEAAQ